MEYAVRSTPIARIAVPGYATAGNVHATVWVLRRDTVAGIALRKVHESFGEVAVISQSIGVAKHILH